MTVQVTLVIKTGGQGRLGQPFTGANMRGGQGHPSGQRVFPKRHAQIAHEKPFQMKGAHAGQPRQFRHADRLVWRGVDDRLGP